jgi:hypothetical protein
MKIKKVLSFVLVFLAVITIFFGAYQLFVDEVEAVLFDCGTNANCVEPGDACGGNLDCECNGGPTFFYCWPPESEGDL